MALVSVGASVSACKKDPPRPPPDPNAWMTEAAKLKPFLPPVLGPCSSTASVETMQLTPQQGPSEYEVTRNYDCGGGRNMEVGLHANNIKVYSNELDGRHSNLGSDSPSSYKDVMIGGGHGIQTTSPASSELTLLLAKQIVVTSKLDHPSPPDEIIPIMNKLDFKGLAAIDLNDVP